MIRVQPIEGTWQVLGADLYPGVEPEGVTPAWGPNGPESLSFSLQQPPHRVHADLLPYTPVEWYPTDDAAGEPLWSGYTQQAPPGGYGESTSVSCVGWHFYREDMPAPGLYVHENLGEWTDIRSDPAADLPVFVSVPNVTAGGGAVTLGWGRDQNAVLNTGVGVLLDCGPNAVTWPIALSLDYEWLSANSSASLFVRNTTSPLFFTTLGGGVSGTTFDTFAGAPVAGLGSGSATLTGAVANRRRYVGVFFFRTGATATVTTNEYGVRIKAIRLFRESAYHSSGASAFVASTGIKSARDALCPLLSSDDSQIETTTFPIRHSAWLREDSTMRQRMDAWNDFHGYRAGVDALRRVFFKAQPSIPRLQVDAISPGVSYRPTSTNDGSEVYNHVSVLGKSGSGRDLRVDVPLSDVFTAAGRPGGVLGMRGRTRSFTLNVAVPTDLVAMEALAEAWLLAHRSVPHKAQLTISADDAVTDLQAGRVVGMGSLGRYYGEMVRVLSVPDPDTGALQSRDGVIASVQGAGPVSLALDSERRSLEALMARMGVVQGSA